MKRTTITIPDDLDARIDEYLQTPDAPASLSAVVQAALEAYLERQEVHEPRRPHTATAADQAEQMVDQSKRKRDTDHDTHRGEGDLTFVVLDDLAQEELDNLPPRFLEMLPLKEKDDAGEPDVSVNHDKYLADWTYNRKLPSR